MPQLLSSRIKRRFNRHTFEIKNNGRTVYRHTLLVNPEDLSIDEPHRANVTQTQGGAYLALFGQGLHSVTISGKTGFHARMNAEGYLTDGYEEIKNLRRHVFRHFINATDEQYEMFWYNWEDEEYYKVIPLNMRIQRSRSEPVLYRYELPLICLEEVGAGKKPDPNNLLSTVDALAYAKHLSYVSSGLSEAIRALTAR